MKKLREKGHISSDVILMVDEMFLQKEASYQSGDYVGGDEEGELYRGIACFMIGFKTICSARYTGNT